MLKEFTLIHISAGELPNSKSLLSSQVIFPAISMSEKKVFKKVAYFCVVPMLGWLAPLKGKKLDLSFWDRQKLPTCIQFSWFRQGGGISIIFKNILARSLAKKLNKSSLVKSEDQIIFCCRSYFATHIAVEFKKLNPQKNIKLIFDMRSLLPPEFPIMMGRVGFFLYGVAKQWEYSLLSSADISLLVVKNGINLLKKECGYQNKIEHVPLQGLDVKFDLRDSNKIFEDRWLNPKISFIGALSTWHTEENLLLVFKAFKKTFPGVSNQVLTRHKLSLSYHGIAFSHSVPHCEMQQEYLSMMSSIIPGNNIKSFFHDTISNNLFSTKAAESLSMGVPLIVNEKLSELKDFVLKYQCGIIFEVKNDGSVCFQGVSDEELNSKNFWKTLTENAFKAGEMFRRENVSTRYLSIYKKLAEME